MPYDVSANGLVVVGYGVSDSGKEASIWDSVNGMQSLAGVLVNDFGLDPNDLTGWTLGRARGISDDGLTIVGDGTNPSGNYEAWIAVIPEPSTALLLGTGLAALAVGRRRSSTR